MKGILRIENGRFTLSSQVLSQEYFFPWDIVRQGKIRDYYQFYYHIHQFLDEHKDIQELIVFMPMKNFKTFQYPMDKLTKTEGKDLERLQEEKLSINLDQTKKLTYKSWDKKCYVSYYPKETVDLLEKCFMDLNFPVKLLDRPLSDHSFIYTSSDIIFYQNKESFKSYSFLNKDWVEFLKKEKISPEKAYKFMSQRLNLENQEILDQYYMIYFMEGISQVKKSLSQENLLEVNLETRKDLLKRFQIKDIEEMKFLPPSLKDLKEEKTPAFKSLHMDVYKLSLSALLAITILGMLIHYTSLKKDYKDLIQARENPMTNQAQTRLDLGPLLDFQDQRLIEYEITEKDNTFNLKARSNSLDYLHYLKEEVVKRGYRILEDDLSYEEESYYLKIKGQ